MKKKRFIRQLAEFLADNQAGKSVLLQMETVRPKPAPMPNLAKEWAALMNVSPVMGWATVEEAEEALTEFFS